MQRKGSHMPNMPDGGLGEDQAAGQLAILMDSTG